MARGKAGEWRFYFLSLIFHCLVLGAAAFVGQASTTAFGIGGQSKVVVDILPGVTAEDSMVGTPASLDQIPTQESSNASPKLVTPRLIQRPAKKVSNLPQTLPSKKMVSEVKPKTDSEKISDETLESNVVIADELKADYESKDKERPIEDAPEITERGNETTESIESDESKEESSSKAGATTVAAIDNEESNLTGESMDSEASTIAEDQEKGDAKVIAPFFSKKESTETKPTYVANPVQTEGGLLGMDPRRGQGRYLGTGQGGLLKGVRDSSVLVELRSVKPNYDLRDRLNRREGTVVFQYNVLANGQVDNIRMIKSSGHRALDLKSYKAFKQTLYHPGQAGEAKITYRWSLVGGVEEMPSLLRRGL